jgi:tetratricopeptide (TPR) repeat protein
VIGGLFFLSSCGTLKNIKITDRTMSGEAALKIIKTCKDYHFKGIVQWYPDYFQDGIKLLQRQPLTGEYSYLFYYYQSLFYYRLHIYYHYSAKNYEKGIEYLNKGINAVKTAIQLNPDFADGHSFYASLLGMKIGVKGYLGVFLWRPIKRHFKISRKIDPTNPRLHMLVGISKFNTPPLFGGGTEKAINEFIEAKRLYKKESINPLLPDWGEDENLVWLGDAYEKNNDKFNAKESYLQALEINPGNYLAKTQLIKGGYL